MRYWVAGRTALYMSFLGKEKLRRSPGSIVEIEWDVENNKRRFSRMFVALKPCIDGFLEGCRPYLGIDSTVLTAK